MNRAALFGIAFPIAVLAGWALQLEWAVRNGTEVRLAVRGFDPRDLLAGHYLNYAVDFGPMEVCPADNWDVAEKCVCLSEGNNQLHQANWVGACEARPTHCSVFIRGACRYGSFDANIDRYYFPESYSAELAVVPERSAIKVVLRPSGDALVTAFMVDGVDVLDYARTQSNAP